MACPFSLRVYFLIIIKKVVKNGLYLRKRLYICATLKTKKHMKQNLKEHIKHQLKTKHFRWIGILQIAFIVLFVLSWFAMIWIPWSIAWRLSLTGLVGIFVSYGIGKLKDAIMDESVDRIFKDEAIDEEKTLSFQQKLRALQEEHERARKGAKA